MNLISRIFSRLLRKPVPDAAKQPAEAAPVLPAQPAQVPDTPDAPSQPAPGAPDTPAQPDDANSSGSGEKEHELTVPEFIGFMREKVAEMPSSRLFRPMSLGMMVPGTGNIALLAVERSSTVGERCLIARCMRKGTDLCVSHYMMRGSHEDVLAYLDSPAGIEEISASFGALSDAVDDKN